MKIFFLVSNSYVQVKPYLLISKNIVEPGGSAIKFVHLYSDPQSPGEEGRYVSLNLFRAVADVPFVGKVAFFLNAIRNKRLIRRFLEKESPDILITGGDITDINGRIFHSIAESRNIPILIVPVTMPGKKVMTTLEERLTPFNFLFLGVLRLAGLYLPATFNGWVLGSYSTRAFIAAPSVSAERELIENGINRNRVFVTGNPADDLLFSLRERVHGSRPKEILYCTELIQDIYGKEYFERINMILRKSFEKLSDEYHVIVKLHPREPGDIERELGALFPAGRYTVTREGEIEQMIADAAVVIAHYSVVLIDAALLNVPLLSLRFISDDTPVRFQKINESLHVRKEDELLDKLVKSLIDNDFRRSQQKALEEWKANVGILFDGLCCKRIVGLIERIVLTGEKNACIRALC